MNRRAFMQLAAAIVGSSLLKTFALADSSTAQIPITGHDDPALAGFDEMMRTFMKENDVPGAAMAIGRAGKIVYARGFGYADADKTKPVQPHSLFRIASLSKMITAAAILQLLERGKLNLTDPAFKILDYPPHLEADTKVDPRLWDITIAHLLHHTAGFDRDAKGGFDPMFHSRQIAAALGVKPPVTPRQIIEYMMGRPLDFDPGTREAYSNLGYCVLGRIIEKVSGRPVYADYVQREILQPLGIHRMRIGHTLEKDRAPGEVHYSATSDENIRSVFGDGNRVTIPYGGWYMESLDSHGGWIASAQHLVRFASSFDDPARCPILNRDSIEQMFARPKDTGYSANRKPKAAYYACGWQVRPMGHGTMNTWHTGLLEGTATLVVRRCDGLTWAIFFNRDRDPKGQALGSIVDSVVHPVADRVGTWPEGWRFEDEGVRG